MALAAAPAAPGSLRPCAAAVLQLDGGYDVNRRPGCAGAATAESSAACFVIAVAREEAWGGRERNKAIRRSSGSQANAQTSDARPGEKEGLLFCLRFWAVPRRGPIYRCGRPGVLGRPVRWLCLEKIRRFRNSAGRHTSRGVAGRRRAEITVQLSTQKKNGTHRAIGWLARRNKT